MWRAAVFLVCILSSMALVGYCVYLDQQRVNDPNYKRKLRLRRRKEKYKELPESKCDSETEEELEQEAPYEDILWECFETENRIARTLLGEGDIEGAVKHFANALYLNNTPSIFLREMETNLPAYVYNLLIIRLMKINKRLEDEGQRSGVNFLELARYDLIRKMNYGYQEQIDSNISM